VTAVQRLRAALDHAEEGFMALALGFMTLLTFVQVILRYGFGTGWVWSLEATTYTFAWLVLIGMSYCVRTQSHIVVDVLTSRLAAPAQRATALAALVLSLVYCGFMIYGGSVFVDRLLALGNNARDIPLPRWLLTGILPVAFGLLAIRFVQAAWPLLTGRTAEAAAKSPAHR
jgi:C4-dicarboxylate transporter DctQ subunit